MRKLLFIILSLIAGLFYSSCFFISSPIPENYPDITGDNKSHIIFRAIRSDGSYDHDFTNIYGFYEHPEVEGAYQLLFDIADNGEALISLQVPSLSIGEYDDSDDNTNIGYGTADDAFFYNENNTECHFSINIVGNQDGYTWGYFTAKLQNTDLTQDYVELTNGKFSAALP
jgi:hypothetical protein